jgi:metallo-beta-lactamase family protein
MLPDSGRIQEEEAQYANRKRYSKHDPALPLYTEEDAFRVIPQVQALPYDRPRDLGGGVELTFRRAGHILGSAVVQLRLRDDDGTHRNIVFSGDLGRYDQPILPDPDPLTKATVLLVECTYGDREHLETDPKEALRKYVQRMVDRRGVLIIPAFSVGRTQGILYRLRQLQLEGALEPLPIFVDSPMATDATGVYLMHREEHDEEMLELLRSGSGPIHPERIHFTRSVEESKRINSRSGPMVIISASGMATGGRVLHHLKRRLPDPNTTVVFAGYQAVGTRGRRLLEGEKTIRIHGEDVPVEAEVGQIRGLSAHADASEVDRWLDTLETPPDHTFCVHGEEDSLKAAKKRLEQRGWSVSIPEYLEHVEL